MGLEAGLLEGLGSDDIDNDGVDPSLQKFLTCSNKSCSFSVISPAVTKCPVVGYRLITLLEMTR